MLLVAACGGNVEGSETGVPGLATPTTSMLEGEWRRDYVTAGTSSQHARLRFGKDGRLWIETSSTSTFEDLANPVQHHYQGRYGVTPAGTVKYSWSTETGAEVEAENSLTFVEGRALVSQRCCLRGGTERWWTHRGYLAADDTRTRFTREALRRTATLDGSVESLRTRIDLGFPASPARLLELGHCTLDLHVQIEAVDAEGSAERNLGMTLGCSARLDGDGLGVILIPGWDTVEGESLLESPSRARSAWRQLLAAQGAAADWPEDLYAALEAAFEPYLAFDPDREDVLFHYLDSNAPVTTGYAWAGPLAD